MVSDYFYNSSLINNNSQSVIFVSALQEEKLDHFVSQSAGVLFDPVDELDHRLLEQELSLQLDLLKEELGTVTSQLSPEATNGYTADDMLPIADLITKRPSVPDFVTRGEEMFLLPNGLAEASAFGVALFILAMVPQLINQFHGTLSMHRNNDFDN